MSDDHVLAVYDRADLPPFVRGDGIKLYTAREPHHNPYLDFTAGIGVMAFGHSHPKLVEAMRDQAGMLWHVSNSYHVAGLEEVSKALCDASLFADKAFICNSGAEAIECGIKMIRKYQSGMNRPNRYRIISFENCFHGRTLAAAFASAKDKMIGGFGPDIIGYDRVPFNDLDAVARAIGPETAGIMIEPIQGEGGVNVADPAFMRGLRALCDQHDLVLLFDEIQCGAGRTGTFFSYETIGVMPDIVTAAKAIGAGFPLGACLASDKIAQFMTAGTHGSTYGGNPMGVRIARTAINMLRDPQLMADVKSNGAYIKDRLHRLSNEFNGVVKGVSGAGLMIGIKVSVPSKDMVKALRRAHMLTIAAGDDVVRLLPPLNIKRYEIDDGIDILRDVVKSFAPV